MIWLELVGTCQQYSEVQVEWLSSIPFFSSHQVILYLLKVKLFHGIPPTPNQQTDSATSRIYLVQFVMLLLCF